MLVRLASLLALAIVLTGCAQSSRSVGPPAAATFAVPVEDYARAFETASDELTRRRFEIERVDARSGVIVTQPKTGAGLLAPWTLAPGARIAEDTLNAQSRIIEVRFEAAESAIQAPRGVRAPLANPQPLLPPGQAAETVIVSVRVLILRQVSPNRRLEPSGIRYSLDSNNPALSRRGLGTRFDAPKDLDERAATQIARSIQNRLAETSGRRNADGGAADQGSASSDAKLAMQ